MTSLFFIKGKKLRQCQSESHVIMIGLLFLMELFSRYKSVHVGVYMCVYWVVIKM